METLMEQSVRFAGQIEAAISAADRFDGRGIRGMLAAHDRLRAAMEELGLEGTPDVMEEPIGREQAAITAERLYHGLVQGAHGNHTFIRLAQSVNRAWAELTLSDGLDPTGRTTPADRLPDSR